MKLVILESPFRGANLAEREDNLAYARRAALWCARDHEAILASHLLFPQFLDEDLPSDRELGIRLGLAWMPKADYSVFFTDRGWSRGMVLALSNSLTFGQEWRLRSLDKYVEPPPIENLRIHEITSHIDMELGIRR